MANSVLIDNDVVLKTCCYGVVDEVLGCLTGLNRTVHVLGAIQYVLTNAITRKKAIIDKRTAAACLTQFLGMVELLEPNGDELLLAAEFEAEASTQDLEFDAGESQLLAIMINRSASLLLTGDKRAIRAIEPVVHALGFIQQAMQRVACFEQLVMSIVVRHGVELVHQRICDEATVDKSLAICFACNSGKCNPESILEGLSSYINSIRRDAPQSLVTSDDLSSVIP